MELNNIILVPTDFSEVTLNAVEQSVKLSKVTGFKIHMYHVVNKDTKSTFKNSGNLEDAVEDKLSNIAQNINNEFGVEVEYSFEEGSIFDLIHKKAADIGANLIVLGTHGKKGMQHLFGSFALKVITQATVPTLVVQKKKELKLDKILLPINTFTEARQKVGFAINVASAFHSTIHIYIEEVNNSSEAGRINVISNQIIEEFEKAKISYHVDYYDQKGDSAKLLMDYAVKNSMDTIMILTESQIGSTVYNLGPWNEKIMFNDSQIPILCINPIKTGRIFFDF